jgi:hypothetical protein
MEFRLWVVPVRLILRNPEGLFELRRKLLQFRNNLRRLLRNRVEHFILHIRLEADQLQRRDHQRELVIDLMPHVRELAIELVNLLG